MEGYIKFEFSVDGGSNWLDATDFGAASANVYCLKVHPELVPEPVPDDNNESMTDSEICYKANARMYIIFTLRGSDYNLTTAAGKALYKFINALRCAPLIRIYDGGAGDIDGYDEFDTDPNTNYLVPHDAPSPEHPSVGQTVTVWNFTLKMKTEYDITTV